MTIEQLEKEVKSGNLNNLYLLYGEETFLLDTILKKIKSNFGELIKGINYIQIDETNVKELISNIETPAFGYDKKLIIAKNTNLFSKDSKKKSSATSNISTLLVEYLSNNISIIEDSVILVFVEEEIEKNELYKFIEKNGCVCNFEKQNPSQIIARLKAICKAYKVEIDDTTSRYLIETCGNSMQDLINEIRKLIEYVGENGTIKREDIDLLSTKQIESVIFDLTDSLGNKNIKKAMETLNGLIYNKEPVQKILITLYNHLKKLYIVKLTEKYNKNTAECLNLKPNQMFLINKYKTQAKYFNELELRKILSELINLDTNYKIGEIDLNLGLEAILSTYF